MKNKKSKKISFEFGNINFLKEGFKKVMSKMNEGKTAKNGN
jgi:hypothetical protein